MLKLTNGINIPLKKESVDLIIILMVLHHVPEKNMINLLKSVYNVLKPNGLLLIREHDVTNEIESLYIDFMHFFYELINENDSNWSFYNTYYSNYMSKKNLLKELEKLNFTNNDFLLKKHHVTPSYISRNYYTLYKKN